MRVVRGADQSITATALISTRQRGSVASRTTCTVVVAGLESRKYSPQTRLRASWSERSVTKRSAVTTSAKVAPTAVRPRLRFSSAARACPSRSEEHTSELQSLRHLVCRLLLEKKKHQPHNTVHA